MDESENYFDWIERREAIWRVCLCQIAGFHAIESQTKSIDTTHTLRTLGWNAENVIRTCWLEIQRKSVERYAFHRHPQQSEKFKNRYLACTQKCRPANGKGEGICMNGCACVSASIISIVYMYTTLLCIPIGSYTFYRFFWSRKMGKWLRNACEQEPDWTEWETLIFGMGENDCINCL